MRTEFLSSLGLEKDIIDKIMAENGKDIEAEKAKVNAMKSEIEDLKSSKGELEGKITELSKSVSENADYKLQLEKLQKDIEVKAEKERLEKEDAELTDAILEIIGDKKFTSEYVKRGIISDMKAEISKPENKTKGYQEILDALTKDQEGIFENPNKAVDIPGMGKVDMTELPDEKVRAVMGLPPLKQ